MKLVFLAVAAGGREKEAWLEEFAAAYLKKIGRFVGVEILRVKPVELARASAAVKIERESAAVLKILRPDDLLIVCDGRGQQIDSRAFSTKLVQFFERGRPRLVIAIGGPYGWGPSVRARADWTWSFSKLTFAHPLAQAIVLEQTYRALTIWKNLPYHND